MSITDSHEQTAQRARNAVLRAATVYHEWSGADEPTIELAQKQWDECKAALDRALALERAYGVKEALGQQLDQDPYASPPLIAAYNQAVATYNACRAAVEEAG